MAKNNIDNNIFLFSIFINIIIFILSLVWWLKNKGKDKNNKNKNNINNFKPIYINGEKG